MEVYEPPVDQLLRLGEIDEFEPEGWFDYRTLGIGPEQVPDLIRMSVDQDLRGREGVGDEYYAPYHAWRCLGQLRAESAIPALVGIFANQAEDDYDEWITEEIPGVLAMIGPATIPELTRLLEDEQASSNAREHAVESLVEVARYHPEARDPVVEILTRVIERAERQAPELNAFLVCGLLDLRAKEAAGALERAFAGGFVDECICGSWYDVWEQLELEGEPPPRPERPPGIFGRSSWQEFSPRIEPPPMPSSPREAGKPLDIRPPDERKDRNKARKKLEQKSKGKGGKRR